MATTINSDNQDDLFERGKNLVEYVPCVKPPFAEINQDFITDRLLFIHDAALLDERKNYTAALKAVEILAKMKGMLDKKEEKPIEESLRKVVFEVISASNAKAN